LSETTYTFLCGFFPPVSSLQPILDVCTVGIRSLSPLAPALQRGPAGQLLLAPTLQLQRASARVMGSAVIFGGSSEELGPLQCFGSPPVTWLTQMNSAFKHWCEMRAVKLAARRWSLWHRFRAPRRQFRNVVQHNPIPAGRSSRRGHYPLCPALA